MEVIVDYFPLFVRLEGQSCLVIGGGATATRKVRMLLKANADVLVVAPGLSDSLRALFEAGEIRYRATIFEPTQLANQRLVVAATNDPEVNEQIYNAAEARGVLVNSVDDPSHSRFITPAIVDRSPIQVAISSGGAAPVLARRLRQQLEVMLPQRLGRLAQLAERWRDRVKRRFASLASRRQFWEQVLNGEVADLVEAGQENAAERHMARALQSSQRRAGHLALVGAGPGDAGLLTLRALQLIQHADVVFHDRLVSDAVLELVRRDAELVAVGKQPGAHSFAQEQINDLLRQRLQAGQRVVRLKGGDPFVFGRGGEEIEALEGAGHSFEVVPGISAAMGCASYAGIPLTHRDYSHSVQLVTAHCQKRLECVDWSKLSQPQQTLVFYMGIKHAPEVERQLIAHGLKPSTPVALVENGTRRDQRVVTGSVAGLGELVAREKILAPAVIIVGDVVKLRQACQWFEADSASFKAAA